jgi:hypothetical protein
MSAGAIDLQQIAPTPTVYQENVDFRGFTNAALGGLGTVTAGLELVTPDADPGCQAADYAGFTPGHIALIKRGSCAFSDKINLAHAAGAVGVLIYNNAAVLPTPFLATPTSIPALLVALQVGNDLNAQLFFEAVTMRIDTTPALAPAPATALLLVTGLAGLGALLRRRRRNLAV